MLFGGCELSRVPERALRTAAVSSTERRLWASALPIDICAGPMSDSTVEGMKFGIFYEHQLPRPWHENSEYELLQHSLDQIELADRLGYDYAWEVEHHFLEEYSHSSAPEVFLGAASQRTKQIRLGHGIIQLTTNHPARVAERVSSLDLVSGGRVEMGIGEGGSVTELHPFDCQFRDKREVWEEAVRCIIPMFT